MRLEDAQLAACLTLPATSADAVSRLIIDLIGGGVDLLICRAGETGVLSPEVLTVVANSCAREDALLVSVLAEGEVPVGLGDGVLLANAALPSGQVRAALGPGQLVGVMIDSPSDGALALEMGADFLLHRDGGAAAGCFAALPGAAGTPLFATAAPTVEDTRSLVEAGLFRLAIEVDDLVGEPGEWAAAYSRLLGRSI